MRTLLSHLKGTLAARLSRESGLTDAERRAVDEAVFQANHAPRVYATPRIY